MNIKLNKIAKKYEGNKEFTLNNINLDIDSKDFCVILGPSGCGKSTLLRMIAGLNSVTKGDLIFGDKRVNELSPKDRDIAMVFQSYALYPHMNVYKNMAFSLTLAKERKTLIHRRVTDAAKILEIEDYLYKKPSDLSGGQRQRVALGRAITRKPQIFLLDEPLSNLDAKLRESMRIELVRVHKMLDTTSVYVTHDQIEAMTMATKIVLMNDKRIIQVGKPKEIYSRPNSLFAARFIGSPSMNLIKAEYKKSEIHFSTTHLKVVKGENNEAQFLDKYKSKEIFFGIRPENISISTTKTTNGVQASLEFSELLGKESQLIFALNDKENITVLIPSYQDKFEIGKKYYLNFDMKHAHFFDRKNEQRICAEYNDLVKLWKDHEDFKKSQASLKDDKVKLKQRMKNSIKANTVKLIKKAMPKKTKSSK